MELEEVRSLNLKPGDMLVIRYSDEKPPEYIQQVINSFKALLPSVKVLILSGVDEIAIMPETSQVIKKPKTKKK